MDITKDEVKAFLGLENDVDDAKKALQLNDFRQGELQNYIQRRDLQGTFTNIVGDSVILVNKRLVTLGKGAGFGELALMSSVKRMASVRTVTASKLAILTRKDFTAVMR